MAVGFSLRSLAPVWLVVLLAAGCGRSVKVIGGRAPLGAGAAPSTGETGGADDGTGGSSAGASGSPVGGGGSSVGQGGSGAGTGGVAMPSSGGSAGAGAPAGGSGGATPARECVVATTTASETIAPALLLLVEASDAMNELAAGSTSTRWELTRNTLQATVAQLPATVPVGLSFFPLTADDPGSCYQPEVTVPIAAADAGQRQLLDQALASVVPVGATTTADAFEYVLELLRPSAEAGWPAIVLVTGNEPDYGLRCSTPTAGSVDLLTALGASVSHAFMGHSISTYVVGTVGSESERAALSALAQNGGTAEDGCSNDGPDYCHIDLTTNDDLAGQLLPSLTRVVNRVACEFLVPVAADGSVPDPSAIGVQWTSSTGVMRVVPRCEATAPCTDGYTVTSDMTGVLRVVLSPSFCDGYATDPGSTVAVSLYCDKSQTP